MKQYVKDRRRRAKTQRHLSLGSGKRKKRVLKKYNGGKVEVRERLFLQRGSRTRSVKEIGENKSEAKEDLVDGLLSYSFSLLLYIFICMASR